jgi:cytochrome c biogenesis protein CcmG, thiol:disulfide interchange protein DsbE
MNSEAMKSQAMKSEAMKSQAMKRWAAPFLCMSVVLAGADDAWADKDRYDVGEQVPSFTLKALNGDILGESYISIDRYLGSGAKEPKKALLLSFFATYCEPCKREIPLLAALYEAYKEKGLQIVLVSIDTEAEKVEFAKTLAKDNGVKFPVLSDRFNIVAKRYFVAKLPNSYLLGSEGKVAMANVGYSEDTSKKLIDEIRKAVGDPTNEPIPDAIAKHMGQGGAPEVVSVKGDGEGNVESASGDAGAGGAAAAPATPADDASKAKGKGKAKGKAKGKGRGK